MWNGPELSSRENKPDKRQRFKNVASDLAQIWQTVTKSNVGNKQQVTQTYTSHATQSVIHLTVWMKSYSHWPGLHMASFLITAECRQTERLNAGYQYNTHKWQHAVRIHVNHSHCQLHLRQWKPFGLPSLLSGQNAAPSLRQYYSPIKTIYQDFVQRPLMTRRINNEPSHVDFPHFESLQDSTPPWPPWSSEHKC